MKHKRGVSLYLAVAIMSVLLTIVLGISVILARQFKIVAGMEDSVIALYAAETGTERALMDILNNADPQPANYNDTLTNEASYNVTVVCCGDGPLCVYTVGGLDCPDGLSMDASCEALYYCVISRGYYGPPSNRTKTQRAIQISL